MKVVSFGGSTVPGTIRSTPGKTAAATHAADAGLAFWRIDHQLEGGKRLLCVPDSPPERDQPDRVEHSNRDASHDAPPWNVWGLPSAPRRRALHQRASRKPISWRTRMICQERPTTDVSVAVNVFLYTSAPSLTRPPRYETWACARTRFEGRHEMHRL